MRAPWVVAGAVVVLTLTGPPASAHTRAGSATDWRSEITSNPDVSGVTWLLYPAGEYIELENHRPHEIVVLGYEGEPYLRIGPEGVERNANSPATYLNSRRDADVALPPRADPDADPEWVRLSSEPRFVWFDHRVHWMPEATRWAADGNWAVGFEVDGRRYTLRGRLLLDKGPPWWAPLSAGMLITSLVLWGVRRTGSVRLRPAAYVVVGVATFNLIHLPDEVAALPLSMVDVAFGIGHNLVFIGIGLAGAIVALRSGSMTALFVGSLAVAFHQGFMQVGQLGASQLPTVWPPSLVRLAVALSVAQFEWVGVLALLSAGNESKPGSVNQDKVAVAAALR